ncbi:hypothetical protein [Marinomonas spartinae]|uniref:hypothetical protein n=1 Tax=Marinomonas spartinae TaxID=1792290 RepID=UPI0018F1BCB0|nr:hypothetical protein [Marinomonas spartinae]MBJ7554879.1 hypothetical protein [Marinomonas spartinae]
MRRNDIKTELPWKFDTPDTPGLYFVAFKLGPAAGVYDFLLWNGDSWETDLQGQVIAHVSAYTLKDALDIQWPETLKLEYKRKNLPEPDDELWSEA